MRFAVLVKSNADIESGRMPTREELELMGEFNEQLAKDGVLLAADGLRPTSKGTRLRFDHGRTTVTDGPFAETKELVAGFWIVQGKSHQEVVERFMHAPFQHPAVIEIRQVFESEDFGDTVTPEMRERRERLLGDQR
ncbi:MAG TPA: YciI family protein [Candidatus Acidoferrales bacterium]|nr:YciI family protein [Candidatus Acidoferrales bacterium]